MKIPISALFLSLAVAGCGGPRAPVMPVVDMTGVNLAQHNRDLADCEERRRNTSFSIGPQLANCMKEKGYKVLIGPN
jgi:hypothetical protein